MAEIKRHTQEEFDEADQRISDAKAEVAKAQQARAAMVAEHWGCQPGQQVIAGGKRYKVSSVDNNFGGVRSQPWLKGRKQKKDGSWGEVESTIYSGWEIADGESKTGTD